jgi:hypothetical protein
VRRALTLAMAGLALAACAAPAPTVTPTPAGPAPVSVILATRDLVPGTQRVAFLLESPTALVDTPAVLFSVRPLDGVGTPTITVEAGFQAWPFGTRGSYAGVLELGAPGRWELTVEVDDPRFEPAASLAFDVSAASPVPQAGQVPPFTPTKTLADAGGDLRAITSDPRARPALYRMSVDEALFSGRPTVVVFASPAYCTAPTCGPQVDALAELAAAHEGEANLIHVEVYDNPAEIAGDLTLARHAQAAMDWGLTALPGYRNESWAFVIGRDGRISARFEGYATLAELEAALAGAR